MNNTGFNNTGPNGTGLNNTGLNNNGSNYTRTLAIIGAVVAFAYICGGFAGVVILAITVSLGAVIGAQLDGKLDVRRVLDSLFNNRIGRG